MPDLGPSTALDRQLGDERARLFESIDQPPLDRITVRAARRRRHHRAARAAALLVVALAAILVVRPWAAPGDDPPPVADSSRTGPVYSDAGITINGLTGTGILLLGAQITDVEFSDPDHGYLLEKCPPSKPCPPRLARTADGGVTWTEARLPDGIGGELDLLPMPAGRLVLAVGDAAYVSDDEGRTWQRPPAASPGPARAAQPGQLLRQRFGDGPCTGTVELWSAQHGRHGVLATQPPDLDVCWVAAVPAADGAWWVGGLRAGSPAVAVTRDGGRNWIVTPLPAPGGGFRQVQVALLGEHVYAFVSGDTTSQGITALRAIFHSADGGRTFTATRLLQPADPAPVPALVAGDVVPLLDGRLLAAGTDHRWYVSADDGRTFTRAEGNLPAVGNLARTRAGYVAYDLFRGGWAAFTADGSTWRKLQIN